MPKPSRAQNLEPEPEEEAPERMASPVRCEPSPERVEMEVPEAIKACARLSPNFKKSWAPRIASQAS